LSIPVQGKKLKKKYFFATAMSNYPILRVPSSIKSANSAIPPVSASLGLPPKEPQQKPGYKPKIIEWKTLLGRNQIFSLVLYGFFSLVKPLFFFIFSPLLIFGILLPIKCCMGMSVN
jgi:hypothetical protein